MKQIASIVAIGWLAACAAPNASTGPDRFLSANGLTATRDTAQDGAFTVHGLPGAWSENFWCAATEYVRNGLHMPPSTRIYLERPIQRDTAYPRRTSVGFTVQPSAELLELAQSQQGRVLLTLKKPGANMSAFALGPDCPPAQEAFPEDS